MNILITGGTGFIGSRLALRYLEEGNNVIVFGQNKKPTENDNVKLIESKGGKIYEVDINDKESLFQKMQGIDIVFHLAAAQHEMNIPDKHFWDVNVEGTRNILDASLKAGIKKYIHGSTIGVYGLLEGEINEESPTNPDNIYGITKLAGEKLVLTYKDRLPLTVIRITETYGPGDFRLLKLFKTINNKTFRMIGNGQNKHHAIYVDDLIDGFQLVSTDSSSTGELFVLPGNEIVTTNQMVKDIAEVVGKNVSGLRIPLSPLFAIAAVTEGILRPMGIQPPIHRRRMDFFRKSFTFSSEKAKNIMNFNPKVSFKEGARKTADWYISKGLLKI
jgi:nucleoside-diphosphate-sugar epimerase